MLKKEDFQHTFHGKKTGLFYIGDQDFYVSLTNYGARLVEIVVKDKKGNPLNVLFSFETLEDFLNADCPYYGATIGRCANRISQGQFSLGGERHFLPLNDGGHHLHGGPQGFHQVVWQTQQVDQNTLIFFHHSLDGEEQYPGELKVRVTFSVRGQQLKIQYVAHCDDRTIVNLTNHAFFNLNGKNYGNILSHQVFINADRFTPVDEELIPTGEMSLVEGTPFDFRKEKEIGESINSSHEQIKHGRGYDHNFILNPTSGRFHHAATVLAKESGIEMRVMTSEPGLQFYSGNFMKGENYRRAYALETQHFPDSPNHPDFPSIELHNQKYYSETTYSFGRSL